MRRVLAIDYGRKRIGLAVSDPLGMIAQPLPYLLNDSQFAKNLLKLTSEKEVQEIVVGYPRKLNGEPDLMAKEVEVFVEKLQKHISIPFSFWDERLTTAESERHLIAANVRREKRKEIRDGIAACLILEGYLARK